MRFQYFAIKTIKMYGFRNNEKYAHFSIASRGMQHPIYS